MSNLSDKIRFSVIVPAFNSAGTIGTCLNALTRQSIQRPEYEIIIVDDGSLDNTKDVVKGFDVNCYVYQKNRGPASARNRWADMANGEIILFTDADCEPVNNWIEEMVRPFENKDITAVKGAYRTKQTGLVPRFAQSEFEDRYEMLKQYPSIDMVDTYSAAYRKGVFLNIGGFDEGFPDANNEDTELSYRLATSGYKLVFNKKAIVYHQHPETLIKYLKTKFWRGYWRLFVYKRYPGKAFRDSYTPFVIKMQTLLMAMSLIFIPASFFVSGLICLNVLFWTLIIILSLPFSIKVFKKDRILGILSPLIIFLRSLAFASGVIFGFLRGILKL